MGHFNKNLTASAGAFNFLFENKMADVDDYWTLRDIRILVDECHERCLKCTAPMVCTDCPP